jgi:hypothetical protein
MFSRFSGEEREQTKKTSLLWVFFFSTLKAGRSDAKLPKGQKCLQRYSLFYKLRPADLQNHFQF